MKMSLSLYKKQTSFVLVVFFFWTSSVQADWVPGENLAGTAYQAVISVEQAQEKQNANSESSFNSVDRGGFSSLSLTRPEAVEESLLPLTPQEREHVVTLLNELTSFSESLRRNELTLETTVVSESVTRVEASNSLVRVASDARAEESFPVSEPLYTSSRTLLGEGIHYDDITREGGLGLSEQAGGIRFVRIDKKLNGTDSPNLKLEGEGLFDFSDVRKNYVPEAVRETRSDLSISTGEIPLIEVPKVSRENSGPREVFRGLPSLPKKAILEWFISLLDNFAMSLEPQEIEDLSSSSAASESALAAASGATVTNSKGLMNPWISGIIGEVAEMLLLSAEQLRVWLYRAEAFDQGSLSFKIRTLRKAVHELLTSETRKGTVPETARQSGYRVISAVNMDQELAALHILANPPRVHPFVKHVLFETQAIPEKLKRYWLDVEKLKELYAKAGTEDDHGNVYFIRYRGSILKNAYRPMPDDMGGRYELVIAE